MLKDVEEDVEEDEEEDEEELEDEEVCPDGLSKGE